MNQDDLTPEEIETLLGTPLPSEGSFASKHHESGPPEAESMCSMRALCEQAADRFAAALAAVLKMPVEVRLAGLQKQIHAPFAAKETWNHCRHVFTMSPFEGHMALDVAPSIIQPIIARLLGGDPCRFAPASRAMTEIEQRLAHRIIDLLLAQLTEAWADRFDVSIQMARVENNAQPSGMPLLDESTVVARFEVTLNETSGAINLVIPDRLVDEIDEQLANASQAREGVEEASPPNAQHIVRAMEDSLAEFRVTLAQTRLSAVELLDLGVGDVITTDRPIDEPLVIDVDDRTQFHARPGIHEGRKAVQIERRIDNNSKCK